MAAPEIRLSVGLDLEFFRGQMRKAVNIAQSEFTAQLAVKINRNTLNTELNNLQRSLERRSYRIELKSNFKAEAGFAERIAATVPALEKAAAAFSQLRKGTGSGSAAAATAIQDQLSLQARLARELSRKGGKGGGYSAAAISRMYDEASRKGFAGITKNATNRAERSKELSVAFASAGKNAANSFIDAFQQDINKGAAAGEELGKATYEGLKRQMQIASPSKKMKKLGEESSEGFIIGLNEGLDDIEKYAQKVKSILDGVARSIATTGKTIGNIQGKRLGLGNIPLMARSLEGRGGRSAAAIGGVSSLGTLRALQPGINKTITSLVALRAQVDQNTSKLSGFGLIIGLAAFAGVPLAKSIVKLTGSANNFATLLDGIGLKLESAVLKAASNILSASSSRLLSGGGLAGLLPPAYRGINPAAGPAGLLGSGAGPAGLLPPAYRGIGPGRNAGALPPAYRGIGAAPEVKALPPAYRGLPFGFDFKALPPSKGGKLALNNNAMASRINPLLDKNFINSFIKSTNDAIKTVQARIRTAGVEAFKLEREVLPIRPPSRETRLLTAGVGRTPSPYATGEIGGESRQAMMARRTAEAYARSAFRSMDVMGGGAGRPPSSYSYAYREARSREAIVPYTNPGNGAIVPTGPRARGGTAAPSGTTGDRGTGGLRVPNLPGAGFVREIGTEFAFAAKQVLLFGTAYKALAFLTGFPQQVMDAVSSLQSFRNTLNAISPTAAEAAASNQFILDTVEKYNIPLVSARDGFTKLYASMKPAGFKTEQINNLYLGISKASATLGLSSDKVDRVTYAFSQMASKGQLMAEEVTGQLGDVIPGALSIMAEAAQMDIKTFKKAMEDGAFTGKAFEAVMSNVPIVLEKRFGKGAEGAAKTFQGAMNNMRTSLVLFYQSFEPVAVGFLNSVVTPTTSGIKTISDGFTAFFSGVAAKTSGGFAIAQELEKLKPAFDGIRANVAALAPTLQGLANVILGVSKAFLQIAGNPFVGYVARVYLNVLLLNTAIQLLNLRALVPLIASLARSAYALIAFNIQCIRAGQGAAIAGLQFRTAGLTLRTFFATTGVGLVLVGIGLLIERFLSMNQALADTKEKALGAAGAIRTMSQTEARQAENQAAMDVKTLQALQARRNQGKGDIAISSKEEDALKRAGVKTGRMVMGSPVVPGSLPDIAGYGQKSVDVTQIQGAILARQQIAATAAGQITDLQFQEKQAQSPANLSPIPPGEGKEGTAAAAAAKETARLEAYRSLQDQLSKAASAAEISRIQDEFEERFRLANSYYDLQEARANSFQKITINFQKELLAIEQRRQKAMLDAELEVRKARESVASEAAVGGGIAPATGGPSVGGVTGLRQGMTGTASGPHFHIKKTDGSYIGEAEARAIFDPLVRKTLSMTSGYGPRNTGIPGASTYHRGIDLAGPANTPLNLAPGYSMTGAGDKGGLGYAAAIRGPNGQGYEIGHNQRPSAGAMAPSKILGSERRQTLATQQTGFAIQDQRTGNLVAEKKAADEAAVAIENYVAAIAPIAEQKLQNQVLDKRIKLMQSGVSGDYLETEIKIFETQERQRFGIVTATEEIAKNNQAVKDGKMGKEDANRLNAQQSDSINRLIADVPKYITLIEQQAVAQENLNFQTTKSDLNKQMKMAQALTADAELRVQLADKYPGDTAKQSQEFMQTKQVEKANKLKQDLQSIASAIGDSFGNAFKGIISGSMTAQQALAGFFQSIGDSFADMAAKMISEWLKLEAIKGIQSILSMLNPATALGSVAGGAAGFGGGFNSGIPALTGIPNFSGSFTKFATGGIVTGPTLGLVGEGRYNEAVVPLPDGKSIPVDLSGMGGGAGAISTNIVINVSNGQAQSNTSGGASDLGRKMEGAVKQVLVNELRPGGLLGGGRR